MEDFEERLKAAREREQKAARALQTAREHTDAVLSEFTSERRTYLWKVDKSAKHHLTPREVEILGMIREGQANKEIASKLNVSVRTVKAYVSGLLVKFKCFRRQDL